MQTILGANGQIGEKINTSDQALSADLLDAEQTLRAVEGSEIAYLTAGLQIVGGTMADAYTQCDRRLCQVWSKAVCKP